MPHREKRAARLGLAAPVLILAIAAPLAALAQAAPQLPSPPVIQPSGTPANESAGGPAGGSAPPMAAPGVIEATGSAPAMSRPEVLGPDDKPVATRSKHRLRQHRPARSPNGTKIFQPS